MLSAVERHAIWEQNYNAKVERRKGKQSAPVNSKNDSIPKVEKREGSREPRRAKNVRKETHDDKVEGMVEGTMVAS